MWLAIMPFHKANRTQQPRPDFDLGLRFPLLTKPPAHSSAFVQVADFASENVLKTSVNNSGKNKPIPLTEENVHNAITAYYITESKAVKVSYESTNIMRRRWKVFGAKCFLKLVFWNLVIESRSGQTLFSYPPTCRH